MASINKETKEIMKPKRIQRKRTKGWRMPENTVYVGRGSKFGNPFIVGSENVQRYAYNNKHAVELFKIWITKATFQKNVPQSMKGLVAIDCFNEERERMLKHIHELKGKNLACWCALDKPCHADVLLEIANDEKSS